MADVARKPFSYRAFWSLLAGIALVGLPWTGIENHLHQFDGLTAERHAWMAAHNALALVFVVAVTAHAVLNWRPLLRYARGITGRILPASREVLVALAIAAGLLFLSVGHAGALGAASPAATHETR